MGYRSDTTYGIVGPKDKMLTFITSLTLEPFVHKAGLIEALGECVLMPHGEDNLILFIETTNWKWYDSYLEIAAHNHIWSKAEELSEEFELSGRFAQVGEDDDDITTKHFGEAETYDIAGVNRSVVSQFLFDKSLDIRK